MTEKNESAKLKPILVTWHDAVTCEGHKPELVKLTSIGFLIQQDSEKVCFANEFKPATGEYRYFTSVPKLCILELVSLRSGSA